MSMPVEADVSTFLFDNVFYKTDYSARAVRRRMTYRVANTNGFVATPNCSRVQGPDDIRMGSRLVCGYIHHRETFTNSERDSFLSHLQQLLERPVFSKKPNG